MAGLLDDILERVSSMDDAQKNELLDTVSQSVGDMAWCPQPGPQTDAYFSDADDLFYGGQAGGGKTDLGLGLALTAHTDSLLLRRQSKEASKLFVRIEKIIGTTEGRNMGNMSNWKVGDRLVDIGGCLRESDKEKYKGIPHDLIFFDEIPDFSFSQFMFIKTWNRSTIEGQRCRVVCAGNPPTTPEGLWVIEYWAPWLDPKHPNPAKDGEIRHFIMDKNDRSHEVPQKGKYKIIHSGDMPVIKPAEDDENHDPDSDDVEIVRSRSRTFIRARLEDNEFLKETDYAATLDSLPAEIRAAYRDGKFDDSIKDDPWQVIPTAWVKAAQDRWRPYPPEGVPMCAVGVDVAQGGDDNTVLAPRYDGWYDKMIIEPGKNTPLGSDVAALVIAKRKDAALPIVDMGGGFGGGVIQVFEQNSPKIEYYAYKGSEKSHARSKEGKLGFANKRSETYWRFREALDPDQPGGSPISLPPSARLLADLTAPRFQIHNAQIVVESKGQGKDSNGNQRPGVIKRLGRSPDEGDAVVMAWCDGAKMFTHGRTWRKGSQPKAVLGHQNRRR